MEYSVFMIVTLAILLALGYISYMIYLIFFYSKGKAGEKAVARRLKQLPEEEYKVINDLMLPTTYGTTQIDHVVISRFGVFVIETKNYRGFIYGGENAEKWTQNIWGNKYSMLNPIRQNNTHVKALCDNVEEDLKKEGIAPKRIEGYSEGRWILMDYSEVIVHIFHPEERETYNLEDLWENVSKMLE